MTRKTRIILILVVGTLVGSLVIAVSLPDGEGETPGSSALNRIICACNDILVDLGLRPATRCRYQSKYTCIANLKQIDGAKAVWALENKKSITDAPTAKDLYGTKSYIRDEPTCPRGGKYLIGSVQQKPKCSYAGHTL